MVWHWNHPASNHCHRTNYWNGIVDQVLVIKLASTFDLRDGLPKKIAVLLDFVQMRGGRALPKFVVHFSQTVYILGQFGDGEGGGDPCPIFLAHWRSKKWYKVSKLGKGGGSR